MMHFHQVFGFHDYVIDARSGRPQPHGSWLGERFITWTGWLTSAVFLIGAVASYLMRHEVKGPAQMIIGAVLGALIAFWRDKMLIRKRAAYQAAVTAYEDMLAKLAS